jgi:hypothetical protein
MPCHTEFSETAKPWQERSDHLLGQSLCSATHQPARIVLLINLTRTGGQYLEAKGKPAWCSSQCKKNPYNPTTTTASFVAKVIAKSRDFT